jgi:hypothetical protein
MSLSNACRPETVDVKRTQLPSDFEHGNYDVICERGEEGFNAIGNRRLRVVASNFLDRYTQAESKATKDQIVSEVVAVIHSAGGRFIQHTNGRWWQVSDSVAW